jgi:aspartyl/asparaginyl-tRNA synthetase
MKMWERLYNRNKDLKGIFIGTAIKIRSETSSLIRRFFSEEMYIRLGWENIMIRQHGPNWKKTIRLINTWFQEDSSIFPNEQEIEFLIQQDKENNIQFIIGKQDQPFKKEDIIRQHNFSVIEIEGDHFSYFVIKKSWPLVKKIIEEKLFYWFNLNLK